MSVPNPIGPILIIVRRRPPGVAAHDGISSRIAMALTEFGFTLAGAAQATITPDNELESLRTLDLGRRAPIVVLGSHLVNQPDPDRRLALLDLARRHLTDDPAEGTVLVEHHPVDWASTAADTLATPDGQPGMVDVRRDPPFVSAVSVFDVAGRVERQPFTARVLSEAELAESLATARLTVVRRLSPTWLDATGTT